MKYYLIVNEIYIVFIFPDLPEPPTELPPPPPESLPPDSEGETSDATSAVDTVIDAGEKVDQNIPEDSVSLTKAADQQEAENNSAIHETSQESDITALDNKVEVTDQEIPNQTTTMKDEEIIETTITVPVLNSTTTKQNSKPEDSGPATPTTEEILVIQVQPKNSDNDAVQEDKIGQPIPDQAAKEEAATNDENIKKIKDDLRKSIKKPPEIPGAIEPAIEGSDSDDDDEEEENSEPPEKIKSKKSKSKSSCCTII